MRLTGRRWIHLVLGGARLMPFYLVTSFAIPQLVDGADPLRDVGWQVVAFGGALPFGALSGLLFPVLRPLEVAAVRALCSVPRDRLADGPAVSWAARRRTALWFVVYLLAGGIVSGMSLAGVPAAIVLLLLPLSDAPRPGGLAWPSAFHGVLGPLAGLALLALILGTTWAAGTLMARCAPILLGPTPADRLAAAERRAADLATRNRLARELHDAVGHALSAVTLQASAARRVLDADPEFARQALTAIEESTREAVAELDTVLGLLREDGAHPTAPAPTLDGLDALLDRTRAAGLGIDATVEGSCAGLPPVVSREAYRIAQEGLSNALRHAGPVTVRLHLRVSGSELTLRMENPMGAAGADGRSGGGRGLHGVGERARLLGGDASAGPDNGVWRLTARLPLPGARETTDDVTTGDARTGGA